MKWLNHWRMKLSLKRSLLTKYILIVLTAMIILPFSFIGLTIAVYFQGMIPTGDEPEHSYNGIDLERMWHETSDALKGANKEQMAAKFSELLLIYPESKLLWVDAEGTTQLQMPEQPDIPLQWTSTYTVSFMKSGYDADPFTTVAFIGEEQEQGFIVFRMARSFMDRPTQVDVVKQNWVMLGTGIIFILFLAMSSIFFYRIRRRLLQLEIAMTKPSETGIPSPTVVGNADEIGRLENAFNAMIEQLEQSRQREQEEELLRRQLIANLSHDLRTPLTTIRGHAFRLQQEPLSEEGRESLLLIDRKIGYLGELIDNLLSYTLLSAGKYPYDPQRVDMVRWTRSRFANWYPIFERDDYEIDLELPEQPVYWVIDSRWMERILDNLLQNIMRHAGSGRYVGLRIGAVPGQGYKLILEDRGPGMTADSTGRGAGIGLSIVSLMLQEMRLSWDIHTDERGTRMVIWPTNLNEI